MVHSRLVDAELCLSETFTVYFHIRLTNINNKNIDPRSYEICNLLTCQVNYCWKTRSEGEIKRPLVFLVPEETEETAFYAGSKSISKSSFSPS